VPCSRGNFCQFKTYFTLNPYQIGDNVAVKAAAYTGKCDAGYICLTGSASKTPPNGLTGYRCPKGSYCLSGAIIEKKCLPGTYMDIEGNTDPNCKPCLVGTMCPRFGMT
jgi:hypothetical protein